MTTRTAYLVTAQRRKGLLSVFLTAYGIWRERRALTKLDSHALNDIGRTASEAGNEARRPVWDAPDRWML